LADSGQGGASVFAAQGCVAGDVESRHTRSRHAVDRTMRRFQAVCLSLVVSALPLAVAQEREKKDPPVREESRDDQEGRGETPPAEQEQPPVIVATNKATLIAEQMLIANGGAQNLVKFNSLQFSLTPVQIIAIPGAPGSDEPVRIEETRLATIQYQASFAGDRRLLRMDEPVNVNGRDVVTTKILRATEAGEEFLFLLDGKKRTIIKEQRDGIANDIATISSMPDMLFGLVTKHLVGTYDGATERNGIRYETISARFADGRNPDLVYRLFVDPGTHLLARWEVHDIRRKELAMVIEVGPYTAFEGLQFPSSLTMSNAAGQAFMRWEYMDYAVNAEIDPARFMVE
jgi:hypothetical protein